MALPGLPLVPILPQLLLAMAMVDARLLAGEVDARLHGVLAVVLARLLDAVVAVVLVEVLDAVLAGVVILVEWPILVLLKHLLKDWGMNWETRQ